MSLPTPNTRKEQYLNAIATGNAGGLPTPITREEEYLDAIAKSGGGGGGTTNYNALDNKPQIAGTTLQGNKSLADLGIAGEDAVEDIYAVMGEMGAKNLISYPYSQTTKTENNVTFTDNGDGTVTVTTGTGGASAYTRFYLKLTSAVFNLPNGRYILSSDSSDSNVRVQVTVYNGSTPTEAVYNTRYGEIPFALGDSPARDRLGVEINIQSGTEVNNLLIKPMIRLASDTDDTYQQYAKTNKQLTDEIANKVDKVEGKGLSTNDYDDTEKGKVADNTAAIEAVVNEYGAKNLYNYTYLTTQTFSDLTVTVNADKSITIVGTNNSGSDKIFYTNSTAFDIPAGSYIINGGLDASIESNIKVLFYHGDNYGVIHNEDVPFTFDSTVGCNFVIYVTNGATVNATIKPMIRDARITDPTYVPYAMTNRELTERVTVEDISSQFVPDSGRSMAACQILKQGNIVSINRIRIDTVVSTSTVVGKLTGVTIPSVVILNCMADGVIGGQGCYIYTNGDIVVNSSVTDVDISGSFILN